MNCLYVIRRGFIIFGALSLTASFVLLLLTLIGLIDHPSVLVLGQSWARTLASLAVIGCLALAAGFWNK